MSKPISAVERLSCLLRLVGGRQEPITRLLHTTLVEYLESLPDGLSEPQSVVRLSTTQVAISWTRAPLISFNVTVNEDGSLQWLLLEGRRIHHPCELSIKHRTLPKPVSALLAKHFGSGTLRKGSLDLAEVKIMRNEIEVKENV